MRVYTHTSAGTIFTTGEHAPSAIEVNDGAAVVNQYGNIALQGFAADPGDRMSEVELDVSVEPPVLRLRNALTTALFGSIDAERNFAQFQHELNHAPQKVSGDYSGAGSQLELHNQ